MIKRLWRGWASKQNAESYYHILTSKVIPSIEAKNIPGYKNFEVMRKDNGEDFEFLTIITFETLQNVIDFRGEDYSRAYVPEDAQAVLERWDSHCLHYETVD